jgi:hypothetical protein
MEEFGLQLKRAPTVEDHESKTIWQRRFNRPQAGLSSCPYEGALLTMSPPCHSVSLKTDKGFSHVYEWLIAVARDKRHGRWLNQLGHLFADRKHAHPVDLKVRWCHCQMTLIETGHT